MSPRLIMIVALLAATGCAQQRLAGRACPLRTLPVEIDALGDSSEGAPAATYRAAVEAAAQAASGPDRNRQEESTAPAIPENLVLSGGGKWGAFGAGFLIAWPNRPSFVAVTGVSTGALQSTFAFLGNEPVAADRAYPAALDLALPPGAPQPGQGRRYIDDLPLAYSFASSDAIVTILGNELTAVRKGAAADLAPLRRRLDAMIDPETLRRVGTQGATGRALFVGVVDMDDGRAYAVDMTDLGRRALAEPANAERYRQCYIDVMLAASSEPLAAFPVFIASQPGKPFPTRMYMDAGLRNGVFLQEILRPDGTPETAAPRRPRFNTSVIVNGPLAIEDRSLDPNAKWASEWSLLSLVGRTKDMLVNQIYEFSVRRVREFGSDNGIVRLRTARGFENQPHDGSTCKAWLDTAAGNPFPPPFMQCLIAYGRAAGAAPNWEFISSPATKP